MVRMLRGIVVVSVIAALFLVAPPTTTRSAPQTISVHPVIDCGINPETTAGESPIGIVIDFSDHTIINPEITNCQTGIQIQPNAQGVVPNNVKIVADEEYEGYGVVNFLHNRAAIRVKRGTNIEIGDRSVPTSDVGGKL